MKGKTLSVTKQIDLLYLYNGTLWTLAGIFDLLSGVGIVFNILQIIALVSGLLLIGISARAKKETQDEMSIKNLTFAKADTLHNIRSIEGCIIGIILIATHIPVFPNISLNVKTVLVPLFFVGLGIEYIMTGILFRKYERNDEECTF